MQNWNQWPVPSGTVSAAMPPPPTGYTAPGTDPMATMQAYMQYYNQPAPSGYTPEQWSAAQQQNWAQWQQWQQQYQQWQAQYGEKYQETMKQYGVTGQQAPPLPLTSQPPPPPPKDDKPPLPPSGNISVYGYSTGAPPPPPATSNVAGIKRASGSETEVESAKKIKESDEELSEAEKTFDAQFKQWEEKFNTWKLQNANHPDKTQYKQYEAKWTSWREKLIERREQMRRKREQQKLAAAAKAEAEKKDMPGGDKILNILSSTENQGLINNLLGIGKTLGLTTKQDHATITSTAATVPIAPTIPIQQQPMVPPQVAMAPMMQPDMSQAWAQWNQYNPAMNTSMPPMGQPIPTQIPQYSMQHIPMTGPPPHQIPPPNFSQPPPGFPPANFSQPPPGYSQPPPPLNTNPPPPPVSQPPININIQQLSKCPPPNLLGTGFVNNQSNQQRGLGKDSNQFRQGSNEDNQSSNFNNRGNWNNRGNRNNFNQGNRNNYNQGNPNDFNKGNDDNDKFGGSNKGGNFGRGSQDNYNNDNNYENCNDDYNKFNFNNFGNKDNNRFTNRQQTSNQQQSEDNMPPELKKLMAKRKAVTDVFKPSSGNFGMDSSSNTSSLSESFKKVSGDKVFGKGVNFRDEKFGSKFRGGGGFDPPDDLGGVIRGKFGQDIRGSNDFGNDGSNNFGNRGSNNFGNRGPNDFSNTNSNNFGTRISNNFENRNLNEFGNRVPNNFVNKGLNFGNFGNRVPNNDFVNKESSENQDLTELSNQVPPDPSNFHDQIVIFGNSENTDKDLNKKSNSSDKPLDLEDSNNQLLSSNKYDNSKEGPLDNFNNTSGQKEFSFVDGKEPNDFVQNKNSGSKEINQMPPNFDVPPPSLKNESDYTTDNIAEFQCSDQSLNPHKQKLENAENEQQFDTITNEQQLDNAIDKNIPLIEKDISFVDPIELKISDKQDSSDVIESIEAINPMIDESAWIPCENELKSNGETIMVQISTEGDSIANPNEQLKEIPADQDIKQNNDFDADIQQQKSDTLPFMGAEDPKAEDMNLQPPPEQPNVAIITTLEEPPTPSFTDEISEEGNFENKNSDKKFQHPPPRDDFNNGNLNDGSFNAPACQTGNFGRQEPSFKSGQFNTAPPPFGQRGNFNQPPPGPSNSKSTIPSLLTLKIDPPPMMLMPSRSGLSDDDQFDSDDQFPHNKSFDADVPQSNLDNNFGSGPFGFNKPPPFNTDGSVDKDRNFSPGPFGPSKSLFNKDGSIDKDRNFSPNSFGSNKFTFGKDGPVGIERNFASGTFGSSKSQFGKDGPVDKDRNFSSSPFGSKKSPFGEDGPLDKERNFGPSGPNKFPFVQEGSIGNDRNFGPGSFGFNKSTCSQDGLMERDRNFRSGLYGPNKPLIGKDGLLLNKGRNFGPLGPFGANRLLGKDGPLNIDTNFGSGLNNISPSNDLPIDDGKNIGPGLLGVVPNLLGSNPRLNELSSIDTNFCAESNHQCDDFSSMFNDGKNNLNEDFVNHNDPSNNSGQSDLEIEKNFNIDSDNSPFSKNLKGTGFSDGSMDIDNRSFGHGQFSSTLQQFSAGSTRNRAQSFDFQATFNSARLDDAPLSSPNQSLIDTNKTVDSFEKSSGFGILVRRGMNEDFRTSGPEFCVGKQFNYNHGEILQDKSLDFLAPTKIIDYSHETRVGVFEFVEPVGIFDYGHGKLKPSIPDIIQDFQNWEDNEHNLNEYNEEMRKRSEKVGRMWTSPSRSIDKSLWDEPKLLLKDKKERNDSRDGEKDRDDRRRDKDRDERRDRDRDERLNDRLRDKDRNREKDRDDRYADRNRIDKDRDDRYRDSDRYGDRSRDKDRDDRYRISDRDRDRSRDKDRDDRYKDREDRYKDRDDRYKDRDDRYKDRSYDKDRPYDKDRDERYKDRGYEKDRDDRYKDRVDKDLKDKNIEKDVKNKNSEKDMKDRSLEKELKDKSSEKDLTDRNLEKVSKDKNFDKDSQDGILETDCEDDNSEKDNDLRAKRDTLPEQKEDEMVVEKSSSPEKNKEQEEKGNKSKDLEKSDDRSKGNISWQDSAAIISTDTTPLQDSSLSEIKQNVLENPPKIMELPKTPNLTMVDDILCTPGRLTRPPKIAIILRGPPGSGKSFVAKLIKDKEIAQGGSAPRILSIDDYFLVEKDSKPSEDNKKDGVDEMEYKYEEAMEPEYVNHLFKAFKKNITDGFFNFIILDSINEKISDYEEMWSFAKTKGFKVYVCEMEMDVQICLKRNIHKRSEDEINRIVDYFEPAPSHHHKLDVTSLLQEQAIEDVEMEDVQDTLKEEVNEKEKEKENENEAIPTNDDSQDSQEETEETGVSKWEKMEAEDKLDRLDGLKRKHDNRPQTMEEFLQVPDYYDAEDNSGKKHVRWADLEERKEQEKMRAVGFVVGQTNWNRMMDPTHGGSALTRTKRNWTNRGMEIHPRYNIMQLMPD